MSDDERNANSNGRSEREDQNGNEIVQLRSLEKNEGKSFRNLKKERDRIKSTNGKTEKKEQKKRKKENQKEREKNKKNERESERKKKERKRSKEVEEYFMVLYLSLKQCFRKQ